MEVIIPLNHLAEVTAELSKMGVHFKARPMTVLELRENLRYPKDSYILTFTGTF